MRRRDESGRIRRAEAADAETLASLHGRSRAAYYRNAAAAVPTYLDDRVSWWLDELLREDATTWVAEDSREVVGLVHSGWTSIDDEPHYQLIGLYVAPEQWASGVGSALYDVFVSDFAAAGGAPAVLEVWSRNDRAISFYERRGWSFDGAERPAEEGTSYRRMRLAAVS